MLVDYKSIESVFEIAGFSELICYSGNDVVLVGSASVELNCFEVDLIGKLKNPIFVYFNHATNSTLLQSYYPASYKELIFIRGGGGGLYGVDEEGAIWFRPKSLESFLGVFLINPRKDFFIKDSLKSHLIEGCLHKSLRVGYPANEEGIVSPTTGYIAEMLIREIIGKNSHIYTIGIGLSSGFKHSATHNFLFEKAAQKKRFDQGLLKPIGTINLDLVPVKHRVKY